MGCPGLQMISAIGAPKLFVFQTPKNFILFTINNSAIYTFTEAIKLYSFTLYSNC